VVVISKGTLRDREAYSAFEGTDFSKRLKGAEIRRIFVGGLATDYCVFHTVMDALHLGLETILLEDACRGVDLKPGDVRTAVEKMKGAGAHLMSVGQVMEVQGGKDGSR
jgi:nicotinamidase/pyrazinamidase